MIAMTSPPQSVDECNRDISTTFNNNLFVAATNSTAFIDLPAQPA
jgi:hypothetical protein